MVDIAPMPEADDLERQAIEEGQRVRRSHIEAEVDQRSLRDYAQRARWSALVLVVVATSVSSVLWSSGATLVEVLLWTGLVGLCALAHAIFAGGLRGGLETERALSKLKAMNASLWLAAGLMGIGLLPLQQGLALDALTLVLVCLSAMSVLLLAFTATVERPYPVAVVAVFGPQTLWLATASGGQGVVAICTAAALCVFLLTHRLLYRRLQDVLWRSVETREMASRLQRFNKTLSTESRTDPLTGLGNRRAIDELLELEWNRCRRDGVPLACILIDIDHFKQFNDHFGHDGGDECLRRLGKVLKRSLRRAGDQAARQGGEEFMMLLPNTDMEGALKVAEHLRRAVAAQCIPHPLSETEPHLTISLGVACMVPDETARARELPKSADLALYEAKRLGRNRAVAADQQMHESARMAARGLIG